MIAKLCTWAPDRAAAIEAMREALDGFEVEGIGHNLPFLSAVMDHPRFVAGEITTAFIAEEWPEGFAGAEPPEAAMQDLAAFAIALHASYERRSARTSGALANHERTARRRLGGAQSAPFSMDGAIVAEDAGFVVELADGTRRDVELERCAFWEPLVRARIDGREVPVKVDRIPGGYRLRHRGADLKVAVLTPRQAELAARLPEKPPADTSKLLLCPMPGLVVKISVSEGDEVFDGQPLAMVEAMKMENVLRAERRGRVAKVHARPGDSLAVDAVILEFE